MTLEELFELPDGDYDAVLEDLSVYSYKMNIKSNQTFKPGYTYKKWIKIQLSCPNSIYDFVHISKSDEDFVMFSTESVFRLGISSTVEPSWFEYFKIKEKDE